MHWDLSPFFVCVAKEYFCEWMCLWCLIIGHLTRSRCRLCLVSGDQQSKYLYTLITALFGQFVEPALVFYKDGWVRVNCWVCPVNTLQTTGNGLSYCLLSCIKRNCIFFILVPMVWSDPSKPKEGVCFACPTVAKHPSHQSIHNCTLDKKKSVFFLQ